MSIPRDASAEQPSAKTGSESEVADGHLRRRLQWAAIRRENAAAEALRVQSRNLRAQVDAEIKDREDRTKAEIADRKRRTEVEMAALERHEKTTQVERYFWMAVVAIGMLGTIALAFVTAGHST